MMAITRRPVILNLLTRFEYEMNKRALAAKPAKTDDEDEDDKGDDWDEEVG